MATIQKVVPDNAVPPGASFKITASPQIVTNTTTVDKSIGAVVKNAAYIPYMREVEIEYVGYRLRPYRQIYHYFDDEPVSKYIERPNIIEIERRDTNLKDLKSNQREIISINGNKAKVLATETSATTGNTKIYVTHFENENTIGIIPGNTITSISPDSTFNVATVVSYQHNSGVANTRSNNSVIYFSQDADGTTNDYYVGNVITIVTGTNAGESREIISYNAVSRYVTVNEPFTKHSMLNDSLNGYNVTLLYNNMLNRAPESGGFDWWLSTNFTLGQAIQLFLNCPEYLGLHGDNLVHSQVIQDILDSNYVTADCIYSLGDSKLSYSANSVQSMFVTSRGLTAGVLHIPDPAKTGVKFRTGDRIFRIIDNARNDINQYTTRADYRFVSNGLDLSKSQIIERTTTDDVQQIINIVIEPTPSSTVTPTVTPTRTVTPTVTPTSSLTPTPSITGSPAPTPSVTPTQSVTPTPATTGTPTPTKTGTPAGTPGPTPTRSATMPATPGVTPTRTGSPITPTPTRTLTPTSTPVILNPCAGFGGDWSTYSCGLWEAGLPGMGRQDELFGQRSNLTGWTYSDAAGNIIEGAPNKNAFGTWHIDTVAGQPALTMPAGTRFPGNTFVRHYFFAPQFTFLPFIGLTLMGMPQGWAGPYDVSGLYAYSVLCYTDLTAHCLGVPQDPTAQTFYVDTQTYPDGVFISSVDLFFKNKGDLPLEVQIRPVVNGYPSSNTVIPGAVAYVENDDIKISDLPNTANMHTNTRATFTTLTYLPSGYEYALAVVTDDYDLDVYVAELGKIRLGGRDVVSKQPFTGSLFKSQNSRTWTPIQDEDLMFVLNRADFINSSGSTYFEEDKSKLSRDYSVTKYDAFEVQSDAIELTSTKLDYYYKGKSNVTQTMDQTYTQFNPDYRNNLSERKFLDPFNTVDTTFDMRVDLSSTNSLVSPMVFHNRQNFVAIENYINGTGLTSDRFNITNPGSGYAANAKVIISSNVGYGANAYAIANTTTSGIDRIFVDNWGTGYVDDVNVTIVSPTGTGATVEVNTETSKSGGPAVARYISKTVTLADGFEASDLRVFLTAVKPAGSNVQVYYKVHNSNDGEMITDKHWTRLVQKTSEFTFSTDGEQIEYEYRPSLTSNTITYSVNTENQIATFKSFNQFAIKVVLSSNDTVASKLPYVYDIRAIALPGDIY